MLEQLFGSRTRWKLLKTFLSHPDERFYVRELTRVTGEKLNSVRRELSNLEELGVVVVEADTEDNGTEKAKKSRQSKKYYRVNQDFILLQELTNLILKSWLLVERSLVQRVKRLGTVKIMLLSGRFVNDSSVGTDVLIVGTVNREKLSHLMKTLGRSFGEGINYTVMTPKEYQFRKDVTDRFLYGVLESRHIKVVDEL